MSLLPESFARTIVELFAEEGVEWLDDLPRLIAECERRWSLRAIPAFQELSYNFIAPATRADGTEVILKIGVPNPGLTTETEALILYGGSGSVKLLDVWREKGALLLERLQPGTPLAELSDDEEATRIAAEVMRDLWQPVPAHHPFPTVERWAYGLVRMRDQFDGATGPLPEPLVDRAESLFAELLPSMQDRVVLHGDLHHWNILRAERKPWLAIDPKGVVGEPAYEAGALLRNDPRRLLDGPNPTRVIARRVDILAEYLGFDRIRLLEWGVAQAVLSAWWSIEDHGRWWEWAIRCAQLMDRLL
jgi:streptomycin 6-kinase